MSTNTRVRFANEGTCNVNWGNGEYAYFDNVQITASTPATTVVLDNIPGGANPDLLNGIPPNLVIAGDGFTLDPSQSMTVTFQVMVNDPIAAGIGSIDNSASVISVQQPDPQYASTRDDLPPADIGDLVWFDQDEDGIFDTGESGIANIRLHLFSPGADGSPGGGDDILIASTRTGPTGNYLFSGVPAGVYFVDLDETTLPPDLYATTGTSDPTGTFITTAEQNYLEADFGYYAAPTAVLLASIKAEANGNAILLTWETVSETDLLGFEVYRADNAEDTPLRINNQIIPAQSPGGISGNIYTYLDINVARGATYYYWLEIVTISGVG